MTPAALELASALLAALAALLMLLLRSRRLNIALLGALYLGIFISAAQVWQLPAAAALLFCGWMSAAVLGMAAFSLPPEGERAGRQSEPGLALMLAAAGLTLMLALTASAAPRLWIPGLGVWTSRAALLVIGLGLLRLAIYPDALRTALALLMLWGGFSLLLVHLSASQTIAGLLAAVTLFLALAGAYLATAPAMEGSP
ncbi:MAG: hypothetical protein M5U05_13880 [Anaerolineales bacterium]|jgi:hypothetical protein|nr:hypothetical protein [Anaerolineales bacterium]